MKNIFIYKTSIEQSCDVEAVRPILSRHPQVLRWSVDTEDIDHVLRIESTDPQEGDWPVSLSRAGYLCEELTD